MNNEAKKELFLKLLDAESEDHVIKILKEHNYWDDDSVWRLYGDQEGNYKTTGNQQALPEAALVEKIINSVDASLINKCLLSEVDPESADAPNSIKQAIARFYEGKDKESDTGGVLKEWSPKKRREEARNITLAATGTRKDTCLTIVDRGEGQTPKRIPETILSLEKSNKQRIRFVQGKFNMGGTGVLRHLGYNSIQLIISKRNPAIAKSWNKDDTTSDYWGFTIVRRDRPTGKVGDVLSSEFKYLAPLKDNDDKGDVLTFKADKLPLMPQDNDPYIREIGWGTAMKLFQYDLSSGNSHVLRPNGLIYRLEALLPEIALPVRMHECRKGKGLEEGEKGKSFETNLAGLVVRLETGKGDNLEVEPWDSPFSVHGLKFVAKIYVFKRNRSKTYLNNEGVIFTINGQSHGHLPKSIFGRKKVGLSRLGRDILVTVDCTGIPADRREDLFMPSRDRLSKGELRNAIERQLEIILKEDIKLQEIQDKRKNDEISERLEEQKPLAEVLGNILKSSPTLSALFIQGQRISMPKKYGQLVDQLNLGGVGDGSGSGSEKGKDQFIGKKHPEYFRFEKAPNTNYYERNCEKGRTVRIAFETDVENSYFSREDNPGIYDLSVTSGPVDTSKMSHSLNLNDGIAQWSVVLPPEMMVGEEVELQCIINDDVIFSPFINTLKLKIQPKKITTNTPSKKKKHTGKGGGNEPSQVQSGLQIPNVIRVKEEDDLWDSYGFTNKTGCQIQADNKTVEDEIAVEYTFYVNIDNLYLHREMEKSNEPELIEAKYVYGNVLLGLSLIHDYEERAKISDNGKEDSDNEFVIEDDVNRVSRAMAPFIVPMINYLGSLSSEEVSTLGAIGDEE